MIINYNDKYLGEIVGLCKKCWSGEFQMDEVLNDFIYNYLPRYYLADSSLSILDYEDALNGFFLVSHGEESEMGKEYFKKKDDLSEEEKKKAEEYKEYLDFNHHKVLSYMKSGDLYLALLASARKGTGSKLWSFVEERARKCGVKHMFFWTDETCNYHYYDKKGYVLLETYFQESYGRRIKTFIYRCDL